VPTGYGETADGLWVDDGTGLAAEQRLGRGSGPLRRQDEQVGALIGAIHRSHGVRLLAGAQVAAFEGTGRLEAVVTAGHRARPHLGDPGRSPGHRPGISTGATPPPDARP
jgi:hypothetical protein